MKTLILIFLVLFSSTGHAAEPLDPVEEEQDSDSVPEDTIWLEEKISPSTQWLEDLVKPVTVWMERKINIPTENPNDSNSQPELSNQEISPNTNYDENSPTITRQQAESNAKRTVDGDILHVKFVTETQLYRIKLISTLGEIHILYLDAHSGLVISPSETQEEAK